MMSVVYVLGYLILAAVSAWVIHKGGISKEDSLGWGLIWPIAWFIGLIGVMLMPIAWLEEKIIKLWDKLENK